MKKIFRFICVAIFLIITWPMFLYKKYGNTKYKLSNKTIIVANHYSTFDPFFIYLIFHKKNITFVTIIETKEKILSRFVTWLFDCLFIKYNSISNIKKFLTDSINLLNNNGILCVFPEGIINPRKYGFFDFQKSYLLIAEKTAANILPLYIYPTLSFLKKSKIYIGDEVSSIKLNEIKEIDYRNAFIQGLIMEYSNIINQNQ